MNKVFLIVLSLALASCTSRTTEKIEALKNRIDGVEIKQADAYKPSYSLYMSAIQTHHSKLWFAGKEQNWSLADFEANRMLECLDDIKKYEAERKETNSLNMIGPILDDVASAIRQKNEVAFRTNYTALTATCNSCHQATGVGFIVIKTPDDLPVTDQIFTVQAK